jgi:hypothetical protein
MNGQPHNLANLPTIPAGSRIPAVQQLKQARFILYVLHPATSKSGLETSDMNLNTMHE